MWKKKTPAIEFINEIPGVAELMPLILARDHRQPWVNRVVQNFAEFRQTPHWQHNRVVHTARCPGIFSLQRHGWILRNWQDIEIETTGDGHTFNWRSPSCAGGDPVGFHPPEQLSDYFDHWPQHTLRTIVKIHTGWRCIIPKGYYLMEMPVALNDESRFSTVPGYFMREHGPAQMNVQLLWHVLEGKTLIKAGTPLAQYVLVPKDQPEMTCRTAQPSDGFDVFNRLQESRWVKNYQQVKKLFSQ